MVAKIINGHINIDISQIVVDQDFSSYLIDLLVNNHLISSTLDRHAVEKVKGIHAYLNYNCIFSTFYHHLRAN